MESPGGGARLSPSWSAASDTLAAFASGRSAGRSEDSWTPSAEFVSMVSDWPAMELSDKRKTEKKKKNHKTTRIISDVKNSRRKWTAFKLLPA